MKPTSQGGPESAPKIPQPSQIPQPTPPLHQASQQTFSQTQDSISLHTTSSSSSTPNIEQPSKPRTKLPLKIKWDTDSDSSSSSDPSSSVSYTNAIQSMSIQSESSPVQQQGFSILTSRHYSPSNYPVLPSHPRTTPTRSSDHTQVSTVPTQQPRVTQALPHTNTAVSKPPTTQTSIRSFLINAPSLARQSTAQAEPTNCTLPISKESNATNSSLVQPKWIHRRGRAQRPSNQQLRSQAIPLLPSGTTSNLSISSIALFIHSIQSPTNSTSNHTTIQSSYKSLRSSQR